MPILMLTGVGVLFVLYGSNGIIPNSNYFDSVPIWIIGMSVLSLPYLVVYKWNLFGFLKIEGKKKTYSILISLIPIVFLFAIIVLDI